MEFLRNEDISKIEAVTSNDKTIIINSKDDTESRLGELSVDLETPKAWSVPQRTNYRETSDNGLRWLHIIGEYLIQYFR